MTDNSQKSKPPVAEAIFMVDAQWRISSFNLAAEELLGVQKEEMLGKSCIDVFSATGRFDGLCSLRSPLAAGHAVTNFRMVVKKSASARSEALMVTAIPIPDGDGNLAGAIVSLRDASDPSLITPLVLDSVADGVFTVDRNMRITSLNRAAQEITGWSREDALGRHHEEILQAIADTSCYLAESIELARPVSKRDVFIKNKSGKVVPLTISAAPLVDVEGTVIGGVEIFRDITNLIQQDLILDSIIDGVFAVDRDMRITVFNHAAEQITGWSRDEVIGIPCSEILHSSICGDTCVLAKSVKQARTMVSGPVFIKGKDGNTIPISISAAPLIDPEGTVIGGVETFRDITTSIQHDLIFDSIADGVFAVDHDMRITAFNSAAEKITGWSRDEVTGIPCSEVLHSSICGDACVLAQCVECGMAMTASRTIFIKGKDGETIPINISAAPLTDPDGKIIGGVETFRDVTDHIQQEMIFESVADGVFTVNRNWKITSFNYAAEQITGWSRENAIGRSCSEVFHSSICGDSCAIAQSMYSGKPVANRSIFIHNLEGKRLPISISAAPLLDHEGNVIGGVETFRDLSVLTELRKQLTRRYTFGEIISKSAAMQRIFDILPEIAHSESNVLILGDSGTGKELVARACHNHSLRHKGPFVAVNCGALPETLLESELFGYKAGAFTDAKQDRQGRFAAAQGGTLFLDEIGDIPASLQVKLLRVLQDRVYEPLGSNTPIKADVRIIAATNRDLQAQVKAGLFRQDLFYRLNVVKIQLPPLCERKEDIPMLAKHFVDQFSTQQGKDIVGIADDALAILMRYNFPGNIRELENIIEYAFILCHGGFIQPQHLPEPFAPKASTGETPGLLTLDRPMPLEEIEKQAIFSALERNHWKKLATCRELGISKDTLRRKICRYQLANPLADTDDDEDEET